MHKHQFKLSKKKTPPLLNSKAREEAKKAIREGRVRDFLRRAGISIPETADDIIAKRSEQPS